MTTPLDSVQPADELVADEAYFDRIPNRARSFDAQLLEEPLTLVRNHAPASLPPDAAVRDATQIMKSRGFGCVLITEDGTARSRLVGIFTERDVLVKIIDCGRDPATIALSEVMTSEPETLSTDAKLAWALNMMSVGGYRHLPVTDASGRPVFVLSVRDIVDFLVESFPAEILNLPPDFRLEKSLPRHGA